MLSYSVLCVPISSPCMLSDDFSRLSSFETEDCQAETPASANMNLTTDELELEGAPASSTLRIN